ncbi:class II aldolase/adducin family protein [Ferrimonas lipolytica]|uniref:Class II aldolase/adducin family protein n=1 Tax=Ferrimonas lipolytica TaxID=2724191 RepID=A0A6H1UHE0_9GAMM|nr:class II aldolase/adducin family protein [Ferrimonas lipolytica]QIZ77733.1 class II aldolase/adducin family protein [Ferrimonas lipolytica]
MSEAAINNLTIGTGATLAPPQFDDPYQQRLHDKQRLAAAFRAFALYGFDEGLAGHITVRDAVEPETFWVNPLALHFSLIKASHLVRVDHHGNVVEGDAMVNKAAFAIHSRVHQSHPSINAVAHSHSRYGRAFAALGQPLQPISQDACMFFENHAVYDDFGGVVMELDEGQRIANSLGANCAAILQNHGLLTVGSSVDAACANFIIMDSCCHSQLLAQAAGELKLIRPEVARQAKQITASELVTWGNFQPLYQKLLSQDASFLD